MSFASTCVWIGIVANTYSGFSFSIEILSYSSLYTYAGQNGTINTFINVNEEEWIKAVGADKANEIKAFYNSFKWTNDPTPGSDKMLPPYNKETISNPKKHVPCRIVPVWNSTTSTYDWGLYCGSINVITNDDYKDKLYTNNGVKLKIESKTGYIIIDKYK